jgi:hypothetical protein
MSPFLPTLDNLPTTDFHLIGLNVTDKNWASLRLNFFNAGQRLNSLLIPPTYVLISPTRSVASYFMSTSQLTAFPVRALPRP